MKTLRCVLIGMAVVTLSGCQKTTLEAIVSQGSTTHADIAAREGGGIRSHWLDGDLIAVTPESSAIPADVSSIGITVGTRNGCFSGECIIDSYLITAPN